MRDVETALLAGSGEFAETLRPAEAKFVRVRGERRRRRAVAGCAATLAIATAAALGGYRILAAGSTGREPAAAGGLSLATPSRYMQGVLTPVTFTIPGIGVRTHLTVNVSLGSPSYRTSWMPEFTRRDSVTGRLTPLVVSGDRGGGTASYRVVASARPLRQTLLVVPAPPGYPTPPGQRIGRLSVRVFAGKRLVAEQSTAAGKLGYLTGSWAPSRSVEVPAGSSKEVSFTLGYPAVPGYPAEIRVLGYLCEHMSNCRPPRGDQLEWLDRGTWRRVRLDGSLAPRATASLAPGHTITIRFMVIAGTHAPAVAGSLSVQMMPDRFSGFFYGALQGNRGVLHLAVG
jgi:hypothetical protein